MRDSATKVRACSRCPSPLPEGSAPHRRLCDTCREARRREQARERMQARRARPHGYHSLYGRCPGCGYVRDLHAHRGDVHACSAACLVAAVEGPDDWD